MATSFTRAVQSAASSALGKVKSSASSLLNPGIARLERANLQAGGASSGTKQEPNIGFVPANGNGPAESDWRVRIGLADNAKIFYKDSASSLSLLAPLIETNGVIFPYTPSISVTHSANYTSQSLTHSNYAMSFFKNSEVNDIQIQGDFTVQNEVEGQYLMAAVYYLRACTKMFFGQGANAGQPPPIVFLNGYGSHYFPNVPCVITSFTHTLPPDVDYLQIPINTTTLEEVEASGASEQFGKVNLFDDGKGNLSTNSYAPDFNRDTKPRATTKKTQFSTMTTYTRLPTQSNISLTVRPIYSRKNLHDNFNLDKFAAGGLLGGNGLGGFL